MSSTGTKEQARYLITSALPYANGPLHFGHLAGVYLPADIFTRHLRLLGKRVMHVSGSDEHGVAIMQNAKKAQQDYASYVKFWHQDHAQLMRVYDISFDFFGQTSAAYHHEETLKWFEAMNAKNAFEVREEQQLKCGDCHQFLPDRFVEGTCYSCGYAEARGDECPQCGTWIDPLKLINPTCKFCQSKNIGIAQSKQWYLCLSKYEKEFHQWFEHRKHWKPSVFNYVESLARESLHDRAMTRDLDWGIEVPLPEAQGKRFYVWFDAPIGYVSNTKEHLRLQGSSDDYLKDWWLNPNTKITNFIGKDNVIFHAIIFPLMSMISGRARPVDDLPANQYVNLFGKQFSKSKQWYVDAKQCLADFGVDAVRYYLCTLIPEHADSSFTWSGMEAKVNNELANNVGNLASRCLKFWSKHWPTDMTAQELSSFFTSPLAAEAQLAQQHLIKYLNEYSFREALDRMMQYSTALNLYFTQEAPWKLVKEDSQRAKQVIAQVSLGIYCLSVFLSPFLPTLAQKLGSTFNFLPQESVKAVYAGDWKKFQQQVAALGTVTLGPVADQLVPKIDPDRLKALENEFLTKIG